MHTIPTSSFFKIRLVILVISFFVFCFVIGVVKNLFAAGWPGECIFRVQTSAAQQGSYGEYEYNLWHYSWDSSLCRWPSDGRVLSSKYYYGQIVDVYYFENHQWRRYCRYGRDGVANVVDYDGTELPAGCPTCVEERETLALQCGGEENIINWDDETCTGECKPPCEDERQALITSCGGSENVDWSTWLDETCSGQCKPCTGEGQDTLEEATAKCALYGGLAFYDIEDCQGVCQQNGPPCDRNNECCN